MKCNKYDILATLLLFSLGFGGIGGALQVTRILAIILLPVLFSKFSSGCYMRNYFNFFLFFIGYCSFSLLWTPNKAEGIVEIIYFVVHFILFFEIIVFSYRASNPLDSISKGWLIAVCMTLVVALWEITTDNHLPISIQESGDTMNAGGVIIYRKFASVSFGNYNGYVTFLCFSLPFLFYRVMKNKCLFSIVAIILSCVCILFNASRGGLLSVSLMFLIYIFFLRKQGSKVYMYSLLLLLLVGSFVFIQFGAGLFEAIIYRAENATLYSDASRFEIWGRVWQVFLSTCGLGSGVGGLQDMMRQLSPSGISIPHNLFLEIVGEFGIVIFLVFILFLIRIFKQAYRVKNEAIRTLLFLSLVPLPIYSIINSGYIFNTYVFSAFASLVVFSNYEHLKSLR
ncbi:MAG TPA: O-antigen ligase family protein [Candidatus Parabacteroides intestinigallinarum]|uniref:O-antigen ligase family protein n=1 Tax=Candidatus Parabacteroides intestinigallinarum TaxID=2838722 RepID=A0A9D1XPH9_9BACT|nr:O-antigen ligase family protein [Candidatus Parabacteroides intestinigallinarum]